MSGNRSNDYLEHIRQAAKNACSFIDGMRHEDFMTDTRTQQAVIMSLVIIGAACGGCAIELHMATLTSILTLSGKQ